MKVLFIINPVLEKKRGLNIKNLLDAHLDTERFQHSILYSEYPGHAEELVRQYVSQYQLIVAGGGDGTINQVATGLVHSEAALGIIPLGSGKGLARSLEIPLNITKAIRILNKFEVGRIDTGMIGMHRFVNIAGLGFAAEVAHAYAVSKRRGFAPYALSTIRIIPGYKPVSVSISTNDRMLSGSYFDVSFANSTQWGYGAHISPTSKTDDGNLDICALKTFPTILFPGLLGRLFIKTIHQSRYMKVIPMKIADVTCAGSLKGHVDGEPVQFENQFSVSVEPGSLKVVV